MNKYLSLLVWILILVLIVGIQFIPVSVENPPITETVPLNEEAEVILRKACFDCHSNETNLPWYARVAPLSFMIAHHVNHGREYLNLSEWNKYGQEQQIALLHEIVEEVQDGKMPLWSYILLHEEANLNEVEEAGLYRWAEEAADFIMDRENVKERPVREKGGSRNSY